MNLAKFKGPSFSRLKFSSDTMSDPHIIYGGDSFVWGEGLELYIENDFWKNERFHRNEWQQLVAKQTEESHTFRKNNRFAGIIEQTTGLKQIVDFTNGGDWQSSTEIVNLNYNSNTRAIVYMFTTVDRNFLHSNINCECDFCSDSKPKPFNVYLDYINTILENKPISDWLQSKIDYLEKYENIPPFSLKEFESSGLDLGSYIDKLFFNLRKRNIDYFVSHNIIPWLRTHEVFLIDCWQKETSVPYIRENPILNELLIPLEGFDGKSYKYYEDWENTFPHKRIMNEFPNTNNGHPTLLQHKYLAKSVYSALKGANINIPLKSNFI